MAHEPQHRPVFNNPRWRQLLATELCDFRMYLEHENQAHFTADPQLAFFLSDLCNFLRLTTGERALVLGPYLLIQLAQFDDSVEVDPIDSTLPEQALVGE